MEEYMESELSGIFRVKLVTKNIERGSLGTQFMHMRVKDRSANVMIVTIVFLVTKKKNFLSNANEFPLKHFRAGAFGLSFANKE